jgi:hypothetical protein
MSCPYSSLQFDPAPRAGEPLVSRRVPDYFLVSVSLICLQSSWSMLMRGASDEHERTTGHEQQHPISSGDLEQ